MESHVLRYVLKRTVSAILKKSARPEVRHEEVDVAVVVVVGRAPTVALSFGVVDTGL